MKPRLEIHSLILPYAHVEMSPYRIRYVHIPLAPIDWCWVHVYLPDPPVPLMSLHREPGFPLEIAAGIFP